ncbi:MAG: lipoyl(octanoyl) transferase LipB [Oligoflexia bacterium]|nr:lipoyl(octanoyl) transferase LipB [Oligoflexia bacterium]
MEEIKSNNRFVVEDLGLISYKDALDYQLSLVEKISKGEEESKILFCSHPPVVTLGKNSTADDLCGWSGEVVHVSRGGKATYHGPKQLIVYPIINLKPSCDIISFIRNLESALVDTLKELYNISSYGNDGKDRTTGVWVAGAGELKIASIGIAVKRWTTYHGMAINLYKDPLAFTGINPCGYSREIMTSLEDVLKSSISSISSISSMIDIDRLKSFLLENLSKRLFSC